MGRNYSDDEDYERKKYKQEKKSKKIQKKKKSIYEKLINEPTNNWTDQLNIEDIPQEEIEKVQSSYINPNSELMQSYKLQQQQQKLFQNFISNEDAKNLKIEPQQKKNYPQSLPTVTREPNTHTYRGYVAGSTNVLYDNTKIKKKIYIPTDTGFNFAGLIIGPKGSNQKRLEEETGCKIIIRGRGTQKEGQKAEKDDWEDIHVLIAGDTYEQVEKASMEIHIILNADEKTRNIIRQEQLREVARLKNEQYGGKMSDNLWDNSNYLGVGNPNSYIINIPNQYVPLILGTEGKTLMEILKKSEAHNLHLAIDSEPGKDYKKMFIEGSKQAFEKVKKQVEQIIKEYNQNKILVNKDPNNDEELLEINLQFPLQSLAQVVGKDQQEIEKLSKKLNIFIEFPPDQDFNSNSRIIKLKGYPSSILQAKRKIDKKISDQFPGQTSMIVQEIQKENIDNRITEIQEVDKGNNYYRQLKDYLKINLDFLDPTGQTTALKITDYYPNGQIKRYLKKDLKSLINQQ